jgi:pimeloyl-ACP methyl ester carboxylesterase
VIIWEPRGTTAPPPPFGLADQVSDLDLVLQHEAVKSCHLIGWCTGPKVAINFYLSQPAIVRSMVFLHTTLKCDGSPGELDSPYEQNIESLCRMLVRKPAMAATVMRTFQSRVEADQADVLGSSDGQQVDDSVLSQMNVNLRSYVLAPFITEKTTVNYAHQLIDFWSHDVRCLAPQVKAPVLLISAEYDQVATPDSSREAASLLPTARHLHVKGATHYCLYDRAEFVAGSLTSFFQDPEAFPALCSERMETVLDPGHANVHCCDISVLESPGM